MIYWFNILLFYFPYREVLKVLFYFGSFMKSDFVSAALANFKHTAISLCKPTIKVSGVINTRQSV
jgi:hypothetical protein